MNPEKATHAEDWKGRAEHVKNEAKEKAGGIVKEIRAGASELADEAKHVATDIAEVAQGYGEMAVTETSSLIRKYPMPSILVGLGVGFISGMFLFRK